MSARAPSPRRLRGQPVIMLVGLVGLWSLLRVATWASPIPESVPAIPDALADGLGIAAQGSESPQAAPQAVPAPTHRGGGFADPAGWQAAPLPAGLASPPDQLPATVVRPVPQRVAAGHAMLMAAGFSQMELPPQIAAWFNALPRNRGSAGDGPVQAVALVAEPASVPAAVPYAGEGGRGPRASRWSADGWIMWRDDTTTPLLTGRPSYGRSQLGAVVRYRLGAESGRAPQAYLRASSSLQGPREQVAAAGLSARPLAAVPLRVAAEVRLADRAGQTEVRPAAYAVTELPPQSLPGGLVAEAYVQGGYVGGSSATAFVDGQARLDRRLAGSDDFDLRAGGGVWGGAQDGGARLDVGPSASLSFRLGDTRGRLAADYRLRVTGDAQPSSGPALTLSAGF